MSQPAKECVVVVVIFMPLDFCVVTIIISMCKYIENQFVEKRREGEPANRKRKNKGDNAHTVQCKPDVWWRCSIHTSIHTHTINVQTMYNYTTFMQYVRLCY